MTIERQPDDSCVMDGKKESPMETRLLSLAFEATLSGIAQCRQKPYTRAILEVLLTDLTEFYFAAPSHVPPANKY